MLFGLWNAPKTFQRALDIILSAVRWQTCFIYLDDVIVFSKDAEMHLRHIDEVPRLLRQTSMTLKLRKCSFFHPKVGYLAHVITPGKISVAVDNSKSFAKAVFLGPSRSYDHLLALQAFTDASCKSTPASPDR